MPKFIAKGWGITHEPLSNKSLIFSVARIVNDKETFWHKQLPRTGPFSIIMIPAKSGSFVAFDHDESWRQITGVDELGNEAITVVSHRAGQAILQKAELIASDIMVSRKREQNTLHLWDSLDGIFWCWE